MYGDLKGGFEFISDTAEHTGRFCLIYFKEDTVINAITVQNATGNSLAGETFVARRQAVWDCHQHHADQWRLSCLSRLMALADSLGKVATNVLKALGADVTIRYVTSGTYNTATGLSGESVSDTNVKGVVEAVSKSEVNSLIQAEDKRLIVSAEELATAPGTKDRVVISSVVYQIISVNTVEQDNTAITHELILRG